MIDMQHESLTLLAKSGHQVPGDPHASTMVRWALRGVRGVRLETVVVGGRRYTSAEAIGRFLQQLNRGKRMAEPASIRQTWSRELIDKRLDAEGL